MSGARFFPVSLLSQRLEHQDRKQVWFAGVHSDIGGGYPDDETGLAKVALEWMIVESRDQGLRIDDDKAFEVFEEHGPDPWGKRHESLTGFWWACEIWPKRTWQWRRRAWSYRFNVGRRRTITNDACVHESVQLRRRSTGYRPAALAGVPAQVEKRVPFSSADGTKSLPVWTGAAGSRPSEARVSNSWFAPVQAAVSMYALGALLMGVCLLVAALFRSDFVAALRALAVWPAWLIMQLAAMWDRIDSTPEVLGVFLFPAAFALGLVVLGRWAPLDIAQENAGGKLPHRRLGSPPDETARLLARLQAGGRRQYSFALKLDFGFVVLYGGAYFVAWWLIEPSSIPWRWPLVLMVVAICADIVENTLLLKEMSRPAENYDRRSLQWASYATSIKLIGITVAVIVLSMELITLGPTR